MSKNPGKKIGKLEVELDRKKTRYKHVTIDVELRFDVATGIFHAQYEGGWYSADTKAALAEQIKVVATKALSIEWRRYLQIDYSVKAWPIEDARRGRPASSGRYCQFDLGEDRGRKYVDGLDTSDRDYVVTSIDLHWSVCEISEPYALPEDPNKIVRACRSVSVDEGEEHLGESREWDNAVHPHGTLLWTSEREAVLAEIVTALGKLDRRLVELFSGDAEQLAGKIDDAAQTDPSRLLTAAEPAPEPSQKKRRPA